MSYTGTEIFSQAIGIIDELSDNGTVNDTQVREYKNRAPFLLDMWQKEMAKNADYFKTYEISCFRKKNLLTDVNQFKIIEHEGVDQVYETPTGGANCFYFEVSDDCIVYIRESDGTPVSGTYILDDGTPTAFTGTIAITTNTTSFVSCKGIITPSSASARVQLVFSGDYYYRHNNRALSPYKYSSADKVPDFKPWYKVSMPDDFKSRSQVIDEFPSWQYEESNTHKWERNKDLYVSFGYEGIIRVNYKPVPAKVTALTQTLEVDDTTAISGAYYLAEHFAIADQNDELARKCREKFKELKIDSMVALPLTASEIKDVYGVSV